MNPKQNISAELANVQSALKAPKGQFNKFGGYSYRSAEDILEAVGKIINGSPFTLTINDEVVMVGDRYYVKATATFGDGENFISTSAFAREPQDRKGMDESQITGATSSYARKYALNGLFRIDDGKDPDATNTHEKASTTYSAPTTQTQPTLPSSNQTSGRLSEKQVALLDKLFAAKRIPKPGNQYSYDEAKITIDAYMKSINK